MTFYVNKIHYYVNKISFYVNKICIYVKKMQFYVNKIQFYVNNIFSYVKNILFWNTLRGKPFKKRVIKLGMKTYEKYILENYLHRKIENRKSCVIFINVHQHRLFILLNNVSMQKAWSEIVEKTGPEIPHWKKKKLSRILKTWKCVFWAYFKNKTSFYCFFCDQRPKKHDFALLDRQVVPFWRINTPKVLLFDWSRSRYTYQYRK